MIRIAIFVDGLRDGAPPYTLRSSFSSSVANRGALVRQVVARLSTGLALDTSLASDEFVWIPRLSAGLALASEL